MDINWEKNPLIPVVAQDYLSGDVLMLAYMDREAFELTLESGYAHYFSRSRNRIWKKGESSNHTQEVKDILIDCDADTILLKVKQNGVACHTGTRSCFFKSILKGERVLSREVDTNSIYSTVDTLYHTILERKSDNSKRSWTKRLLEDKSLLYSKIEEEAKEPKMMLLMVRVMIWNWVEEVDWLRKVNSLKQKWPEFTLITKLQLWLEAMWSLREKQFSSQGFRRVRGPGRALKKERDFGEG